MITVIQITLPFFTLIFLGIVLRRINFLLKNTTQFLARFAFFILMPALVFSKIYNSSSNDFLNFGFIARYEVVTIFLFALALPIGLLIKLNYKTIGIWGLNCAYPNYGYIGIPLCIMAFGDNAVIPIALILFADTIVLLLMTSIYVAADTSNGSLKQAVKLIPKTLLSNPLILAVIIGFTSAWANLSFPSFLLNFLNFLADAASPIALIALGASLSIGLLNEYKFELSLISLIKLFVHPLLIAGIFLIWPGQDIIWIKTAILCASLPVAANVFMLAAHFEAYSEQSASSIMLSTLLSTITVTIVLYLLEKFLI